MSPLLALLLTPFAAHGQEYYAPGATITDGISVHLTEEGLSAMGTVAATVLPGEIPIDPVSDSGGSGICLLQYAYSLDNMYIGLEVVDLKLIPGTGELTLDLDILISISEPTDPFVVTYDALCLDGTCVGNMDPFLVTVQAPISMAVTAPLDPLKPIDVTVGEIVLNLPPSLGSYLQMESGCGATVEEFLNLGGLSLYGLITDLLEPLLLDQVQSFGDEIETQLEDALVATNFEDEFEVVGTTLYVHLFPGDVVIEPAGLEIVMSSEISSDQGDCMVNSGSPGSLKTPSSRPTIISQPAGTQMALHISDDMLNQAMWSIWDGGVMCFTLPDPSGEGIELPLPLNTDLLDVISGNDPDTNAGWFAPLFPETADLLIKTDPREPLAVDYATGNDVEIDARGLDVNLYAYLEYRDVRVIGITIDADVPINVAFNGTTGALDLDVDLSSGAIRSAATHNELVPAATADIAVNFDKLVQTIIGTVAGDALSGLSFTLPSSDGVGLQSLDISTSGTKQDWLTARAELGEVTYGAGSGCGCGEDSGSGCDSGEGTSGCSAASKGTTGLFALLLPLLFLRRRQD